jgi:hypothetical protein
MLNDLFGIYKIGKDLGLSKKEINLALISGSRKLSIIWKILIILLASFIVVVMSILTIEAAKNVYPAGTLYSTVKIKDFRKKSNC